MTANPDSSVLSTILTAGPTRAAALRAVCCGLLLAGLVAACGSGGDADPASATFSPREREVVEALARSNAKPEEIPKALENARGLRADTSGDLRKFEERLEILEQSHEGASGTLAALEKQLAMIKAEADERRSREKALAVEIRAYLQAAHREPEEKTKQADALLKKVLDILGEGK